MRESYIRFIQYSLAVVIVVTIAIHLHLFSSLIGPGYRAALEWTSVASRMNNVFYDITYAILLFAALTHGFIGLRNIIYEVVVGDRPRMIIGWLLLIIYLIILVYGMAPILVPSP